MKLDPDAVTRLVKFIVARDAIRVKKESGASAPWTSDFALSHFRFCNVHRSDDKVTRWVMKNVIRKVDDAPALSWFYSLVCRMFNNPETLEQILLMSGGALREWDPGYALEICHKRASEKKLVFNPAYIVSTNGYKMEKADYVVNHVLSPAWGASSWFLTGRHTLDSLGGFLVALNGVSGFIAGQIIADVKPTSFWKDAPDWMTFALSGPGSRRGMNRVCGREVMAHWREAEWHDTLMSLRDKVNARCARMVGELCAQDAQNCLCEFDKYERFNNGEGRPKQLYLKGAR